MVSTTMSHSSYLLNTRFKVDQPRFTSSSSQSSHTLSSNTTTNHTSSTSSSHAPSHTSSHASSQTSSRTSSLASSHGSSNLSETKHLDPTPEDEGLFESLRALRKRMADAQRVPAYIVFSDKVLWEIAARRPKTEAEMLGVSGVGPAKLERYGREFLGLLNNHPSQPSE